MNASEVKVSLRRRYEATSAMWDYKTMGYKTTPGEWTCLSEWWGIDLLAISAWSNARFIGHEVKVSRGDYRTELLKPHKREHAKMYCDEFFFAVPKGLLTTDELEFKEPNWKPEDYVRERCPARCFSPTIANKSLKRSKIKVKGHGRWPIMLELESDPDLHWIPCEECGAKGYKEKSLVERESPTLWVPKDVGLIECTQENTYTTRKSPRNKEVVKTFTKKELGQMVRWASFRPDPRHAER